MRSNDGPAMVVARNWLTHRLAKEWAQRGVWLALFLVGSFCARAFAQEWPPLRQRTQLQLQLGVVDYTAMVVTPGPGVEDSNQTYGTFGLASRVGLGVGYHFTDRLQLHVLAGVTTARSSVTLVESDATTRTRGVSTHLLPTVRYMCNEARQRFFVGAGLGYTGSKTSIDNERLTVSSHGMLLGGVVGAYLFLTEQLSIDPALEVYFHRSGLRTEQEVPTNGFDTSTASGKGVRLMLTVGLSGWLWKRPRAAPPAAVVVEPEPTPTAAPSFPYEPRTARAREAQIFSSKVADLTFELHADSRHGADSLTVVVTRHVGSMQEPKCGVALVHDRGTERLDVSWQANGSDTTGTLETGRASASLDVLTVWATGQPHLSVCDVKAPLDEHVRAQLEETLQGFRITAGLAAQAEPGVAVRGDGGGAAAAH